MTAEPLTMDEARARMLANVRAAGGRTVEDEAVVYDEAVVAGEPPLQALGQAPSADSASRSRVLDLDLDAEDSGGEVRLMLDGQQIMLAVPALSSYSKSRATAHALRLQALMEQMGKERDGRRREALAQDHDNTYLLFFRSLIPSLTADLYRRLGGRNVVRLDRFCRGLIDDGSEQGNDGRAAGLGF